mgnify:CR=1 FL=1
METTNGYMNSAKDHMDAALASEKTSQSWAIGGTNTRDGEDENNSKYYSDFAKSYTVGNTGMREGEDTDNALFYYEEMKDMYNTLNVFVPKGTVFYSELSTLKETAVAGYVYNIKDNFITDETFREGSGVQYTAGTNVYYTADGVWDCLGGSSSIVADVNEIKEYLGI